MIYWLRAERADSESERKSLSLRGREQIPARPQPDKVLAAGTTTANKRKTQPD